VAGKCGALGQIEFLLRGGHHRANTRSKVIPLKTAAAYRGRLTGPFFAQNSGAQHAGVGGGGGGGGWDYGRIVHNRFTSGTEAIRTQALLRGKGWCDFVTKSLEKSLRRTGDSGKWYAGCRETGIVAKMTEAQNIYMLYENPASAASGASTNC